MVNKYTNDLESVENFELAKLDNFVGWHCHHRLETHFSDGTHRPGYVRLTRLELIALGMYYDRPAEELIFMRAEDHKRLHQLGMRYGPLTRLKHSVHMLGHKLYKAQGGSLVWNDWQKQRHNQTICKD